jgi:hypothetical protein
MRGGAWAGAAMLVAAGSAVAWAQADSDLPRDRQVLLERHLGHLAPTDDTSCVQRRRISDVVVISDNRILYRAGRNLVYENNLSTSCEGMARSPYMPATLRTGSQICSGDVIELVSPGRTASCTLGSFRVWTRQPAGHAD